MKAKDLGRQCRIAVGSCLIMRDEMDTAVIVESQPNLQETM